MKFRDIWWPRHWAARVALCAVKTILVFVLFGVIMTVWREVLMHFTNGFDADAWIAYGDGRGSMPKSSGVLREFLWWGGKLVVFGGGVWLVFFFKRPRPYGGYPISIEKLNTKCISMWAVAAISMIGFICLVALWQRDYEVKFTPADKDVIVAERTHPLKKNGRMTLRWGYDRSYDEHGWLVWAAYPNELPRWHLVMRNDGEYCVSARDDWWGEKWKPTRRPPLDVDARLR